MKESFFGRQNKKPQATRQREFDPSRRAAMKKIGGALAGAAIGAGVPVAVMESLEKKKRPDTDTKDHAATAGEVHRTSEDEHAPESYTFLETERNPETVEMGRLAGQKFSGLYAKYLGIPDGSVVPEVLAVDFKANLGALWREKLHLFDEEEAGNEKYAEHHRFLKKRKELMDLAEREYRSYSPAHCRRMKFGEYTREVEEAMRDGYHEFMQAMYALREDPSFPDERRALIEKMATHVNADTLLACSLTELMPSASGELNAEMMSFLLEHAGADFLDRIPSLYDTLPSFGPYQLTEAVFEKGGVGAFGEKIEAHLPPGFMPESITEVSGAQHHLVAYVLAIEHIAQFAGSLDTKATAHARDVFAHTDGALLHTEVAAFTATAHHQPKNAYTDFESFVKHTSPHEGNREPLRRLLERIHDKGLHAYAHKAIENYGYLAQSDLLAKI